MGSELAEQVALVTGGVRGIGLAISEALMGQGARVAAGFSRNGPAAESFIDSYADRGATIHQGTIEDYEDCERVVGEVIERHGRLDILVNNAGITSDKTVFKMSDEDWYKVLAVNLSGAFFMSKAALEHMVDRGTGRIINISSIIGQQGNIGQTNYAASKSGLFGLTMSMAREAAHALKKGDKLEGNEVSVTVNTVAPGFIETEMLESVPEKVLDGIRAQVPLKRLGRPEEVARVVHFLAADKSGYITGQVWAVNGGQDMSL
jgi:NAD(P)-dependent dehydrogenase (short-subunit alcohol dehydrogenase family)